MTQHNIIHMETLVWFTLETATENAYWWSRGLEAIPSEDGIRDKLWEPTYCTAIKGIPENPDRPNECWQVTNRFDPRVAKGDNYV